MTLNGAQEMVLYGRNIEMSHIWSVALHRDLTVPTKIEGLCAIPNHTTDEATNK